MTYSRRYSLTAKLLILALASLVTACDNKPINKPSPAEKSNQTVSLIEEKPETIAQTQSDNSTSISALEHASEQQLSIDIPAEAPTETPNSAHEKLILDLGFSEAQNGDVNIGVNTKPDYCLGSSKENEEKQETSSDNFCKKVSNRLASVSMESCLSAKLETNGCESVKGFPIVTTSFLPVDDKTPQGKILIIGGTHADELTSVSTVFKWIEKLNKFHSGLFHWHIAPIMNPDGLFQRSASRTNHNGVDLNRNMPTDDWHSNAILYWETKGGKNPRKYPGKNPSSEPETQWLIDEINNFQPDAIISVHAPYGIVDFDSLLLKNAPKSLGKLHLNLLGTYPGSLGNYAGINRNIPVITVELPHAWEMPSDKEISKIWEDIVGWLKTNINTTAQASVSE